MSVPSFGLGTFRLTGQTVIDSVKSALAVGYRVIDTAQIYKNEAEVGQAIAESGVPRSELFITTKIWVDNYAADKLIPMAREGSMLLRKMVNGTPAIIGKALPTTARDAPGARAGS